jgi:hypothetical protein
VTLGRVLTASFRLLPDVVIIGAQRCGTTTLFHTLARHPQIAASTTKEVHFFDNNYQRGQLWYRAHFPTVFERRWRERSGRPLLACEASPYYLFHPHAPARLKALLPHARLIVILRNPVERAYSHYHHSVRRGYEQLPFDEAVDREEERLAGEVDRMLADPGYFSFPHQRRSYCNRGIYVDQLEAWCRLFPRDQLLILHLPDLTRAPALTWSRVFGFLNIEGQDLGEVKALSVGGYNELNEQSRRSLERWFRPHNARLFEWLGYDLDWDAG